MAKVVVEVGAGRILGAHILGYHAAEPIHPIVVAMTAGGGIDAMRRRPHIHPTLGEFVASAVEAAPSKSARGEVVVRAGDGTLHQLTPAGHAGEIESEPRARRPTGRRSPGRE